MKSKTIQYIILILLTFVVLPWIILRLLSKYPQDLMTYTGIALIIPSFVLLLEHVPKTVEKKTCK